MKVQPPGDNAGFVAVAAAWVGGSAVGVGGSGVSAGRGVVVGSGKEVSVGGAGESVAVAGWGVLEGTGAGDSVPQPAMRSNVSTNAHFRNRRMERPFQIKPLGHYNRANS